MNERLRLQLSIHPDSPAYALFINCSTSRERRLVAQGVLNVFPVALAAGLAVTQHGTAKADVKAAGTEGGLPPGATGMRCAHDSMLSIYGF